MEDIMYVDYEYDDNSADVEYADYYEDDKLESPEDSWESADNTEEPSRPLTLDEIYRFCIIPTATDSYRHIVMILSFSVVFLISSRIIRLPAPVIHLSSSMFGAALVWQMFQWRCYYMGALLLITYFVLCISHCIIKRIRGPSTCIAGVVYLVVCEFWFVDPLWWHAIRGIQMVILMKIVSVGYDLDNEQLKSLPNPLEIFGYIVHPGSIIFGPWIPFATYNTVLLPMKWSLRWLVKIIIKCAASGVFLIISTCFVTWSIPDNSNKWLLSYRDALSFRSSHYFVSYLSEVTSGLSGIEIGDVAKPYYIELPRSLVEVVIFWNMPMHHWLKTYVFKPARTKLGIFSALLMTYGASSLFHGLNFQLAAVLFSLGFYTYTEHTLRKKLSNLFDACIMARPCSESCEHSLKGSSLFSRSVNLFFGLLTAFHLAYLGMMFDSSNLMQERGYSMIHTIRKWGALHYASHWVTFVLYVLMAVL